MTETTYYWYRTPIGFLTIAADGVGITRVAFGCETVAGARKAATPATTEAANQVLEYLAGKRRTFHIPTHVTATEFQLRVWDALRQVPFGQSVTATSLAESIGAPESFRAVGSAAKANPLAILIPDHRILTAAGRATGSGKEAERREWLLRFERSQVQES